MDTEKGHKCPLVAIRDTAAQVSEAAILLSA